MTHAQWHARIRRSLALIVHKPVRALEALEKLLDRLESDAKRGVGEWHVEQTLEAISLVQSRLQDHRHAAETMLRAAERHEHQLAYYRRGFVAACATAAIELTAAGDRTGARRALRRARPLAAGLRPQEALFLKAERVVGS